MKPDGRFYRALRGETLDVPPIWLMRQAGRYHTPYGSARKTTRGALRAALAAEVAMDQCEIRFDAAILLVIALPFGGAGVRSEL